MKLIVSPDYLRWLMRRNGLKVRDLAKLAGTNPSTVSRLASGVQAGCRGDVGINIERALKEDVGSLFGERRGRRKLQCKTVSPEGGRPDSGGEAVPAVNTGSQKPEKRGAAA